MHTKDDVSEVGEVAAAPDRLSPADKVSEAEARAHDEAPASYSPEVMRRVIEATVMVSADPLPAAEISALVGLDEVLVAQACRNLANDYEDEGRGFQLAEVAGGWRYQSHPSMAPVVEHMVREGQNARLSPAALETLAIVAYKQPISRAQVSSIRGVNVEAALRSLVARGLVDEVGRDPGPGQAILYGTTSLFLERLGLASVAELPPVADFVPGPEVVDALEQGLRPLVD